MQAAKFRRRPILLTALTFIFDVASLAIAAGAGAASRQSLGTTVLGGMIASTVFGLIFTTVFYVSMERLLERRRPSTVAGSPAPAE